jgi:Peptidase family M20/M25/M40
MHQLAWVALITPFLQAWTTNPFIMTQKDGYLLGRGTSDNKGPILAMLFAVKELLDRREGEACAGLPCNLSFIFEACIPHICSPTNLGLIVSFPDPMQLHTRCMRIDRSRA